MDDAGRYREFEDRFLRQLRARAEALLRRGMPADQFRLESVPDGIDAVRATLTRLEEYDRDLIEKLPGTRAVQLRFKRRVLGPFTRTVGKLRAQVLAPIELLVAGKEPGPVGLDQVETALARYDLMPQREQPRMVVFASPTGFTAEARARANAPGDRQVVLLGGRADGGWDADMPDDLRRGPWAALFDLESQDERLRRLLYHLDKNATLLESRGLSLPELAEQLGMSPERTEALVRQACRSDSRLMTVVHDDKIHVCRSPLAEESNTMSLRSWIRKLLRLRPTVGEQVKAMTAQRVQLEQQRHEIDQRLEALEKEEREAVERGAAAKTDVERKQLAGKLMRTRRNLRRLRAQANIYTQQIDILGTHIHHLTLEEQGKRIELPDAEELARTAAQAEQVTSELAANADLAAGIEVGAQSPMMAEEEAEILAEFERAASSQASSPAAAEDKAPEPPAVEPAPPSKTAQKDKSARPELG